MEKTVLQKLIKWAKSEGYERVVTNYKGISEIRFKEDTLNLPNEILIQGNISIEKKVYYLLHELGHHQLRKDWDNFEKRFPLVAKAVYFYVTEGSSRLRKRIGYKVSSMDEEIQAWEEGRLLAKKLNIKIDLEEFDKLKNKCLMNYMRYFAKN